MRPPRTTRQHKWALLLFLGTQSLSASEAFAQTPTPVLVKGVLARAEAIFSGDLEYSSATITGNAPQRIGKSSFLLTGSSWRLDSQTDLATISGSQRSSGGKAGTDVSLTGSLTKTEVSHHGTYLLLTQVSPSSGEVSSRARIDFEKPHNLTMPSPPIFGGTIWFDVTKSYLAARPEKVRRIGEQVVHGMRTTVIECDVGATEALAAFHAVNERSAQGGVLRLYVSEDYGFTLPRYEYVGSEGVVAASFEASDFVKTGTGVYVPRQGSLQYFKTAERTPSFSLKYEIHRMTSVNEQIADGRFIVSIPVGTKVADSRPGTHSLAFEVSSVNDVPADLKFVAVRALTFWGRNWWTACIIGAVGTSLLFLAWRVRMRMVAAS